MSDYVTTTPVRAAWNEETSTLELNAEDWAASQREIAAATLAREKNKIVYKVKLGHVVS